MANILVAGARGGAVRQIVKELITRNYKQVRRINERVKPLELLAESFIRTASAGCF